MKAYDFDAITFEGDVYCNGCFPGDTSNTDCSPVFADSEWDSYPTCCICGYQHDYVSLTVDGLHSLASQTTPYYDRFDIVEAHYVYLSDYHSGMTSPEYKRLSKLSRYFNPRYSLSGFESLNQNAQAIYEALVKKHSKQHQ